MKTKESQNKNIAILLSTLDDEYQKTLVSCFTRAAEKKKIHLSFFAGYSLCSPYGYQAASNSIYALIHRRRFVGVVISSTLFTYVDEHTIRTFLAYFEQEQIPFLLFSYNLKGYPCIRVGAEKAIYAAIEHLAQNHGVKRIGFIRGPINSEEANERFLAYQKGLERYQLPFEQDLVFHGDYGRFSGYHVIEEYLVTGNSLPDAILAANDLMALGALECFRRNGISVPDEVKIIGFDDIGEGAVSIPSLSTIRQPLPEMAVAAIEYFHHCMDGGSGTPTFPRSAVSDISIEASFVRRESCGCFDTDPSTSFSGSCREGKNYLPSISSPGPLTSQPAKEPCQIPEDYPSLSLQDSPETRMFQFKHALSQAAAGEISFEELKKRLILSISEIPLLETYILELQKNSFHVHSQENVSLQTKTILLSELLSYIYYIKERLLLQQSYLFTLHLQDFEYASQFITVSFNLHDLITNLKNTLSRLNIENFFLSVYSSTVHWNKKLFWKLPATSKIILYLQKRKPYS
ncbi:MAG: substrate-binding domain-containing protein [Treponemataceae bacterium]|nr:substrate-binding domain-containing protein [Treponemataceae bacterium]